MANLRIHHLVPNFEAWKRAFDNDPMNRAASGVRKYQVARSIADPNFVMIDLEFASTKEAEAMLLRLRTLWEGPGGAVMRDPQAWVTEPVESRTL